MIPTDPTINQKNTFDLTSGELDRIKNILSREPNQLELEIFALLWSEHASYKNSLYWLKTLPRTGENILIPAGAENAGAVDIGNGLACVFKVESHNHPCAIQPRLGALTGMRVVTRDIISMGAAPVAFLDSLRFGSSTRDTAKWLFEEVIKGVAQFGKEYNVPVVGGEVCFDSTYNSNPIVNNMAVGIAAHESLTSGRTIDSDNLIVLAGTLTGNDGVFSDAFSPEGVLSDEEQQVSFREMEKITAEANLQQLIQKLIDNNIECGVQSIGAQGIVGALAEMAARGDHGATINTDLIPTRGDGLSAREKIMSQTWGRLLLNISPDDEQSVMKIAAELDLSCAVIAHVNNGDYIKCTEKGKTIVSVPARALGLGGEAPLYKPEYEDFVPEDANVDVDSLPEPDHYPSVVKKMLNDINLTSKAWLINYFNKTTVVESLSNMHPADAATIRIDGTNMALAVTMDCNPNYMKTDPFVGSQIAVAEAARNIVCSGGKPLAVSDCLNFGSPHDKAVYGQFVASIKGISSAVTHFNTPVISGNVSFFNQSSSDGVIKAITPTPVIGMVGVIADVNNASTLMFKHKGDMIFLIGRSRNDVNSSEYLKVFHNIDVSNPPYYNHREEVDVQEITAKVIEKRLVRSVHDVSNGGLFFTLLESAAPLELGFDITTDAEVRKDAFLFGESQSRVVVTVSPQKQDDFIDVMMESGVPFSTLGHVTKGEIRIDDESYGFIYDVRKKFLTRFKQWLEEK
jgi:phosphoribosylformylglycinamidine synthase